MAALDQEALKVELSYSPASVSHYTIYLTTVQPYVMSAVRLSSLKVVGHYQVTPIEKYSTEFSKEAIFAVITLNGFDPFRRWERRSSDGLASETESIVKSFYMSQQKDVREIKPRLSDSDVEGKEWD